MRTDDSLASRRHSIAPVFTSELPDKGVQEGDNTEMFLYVTGTPEPEIVWYKDNQPITLYPHRRFNPTREGELCGLEILDARCSDQGGYTCRAYNTAGEVRKSCQLTVHQVTPTSPPQFTKQLKDVHIVEGGCTRFDVNFSAMPDPTVTWFKDGVPVREDSRCEIIHHEDSSALILMYAKPSDAGAYACVAENSVGRAENKAQLFVLELQTPPNFVQRMKNADVPKGETAKLECRVTGKPDPAIVWYKGAKELQHDSTHFTSVEQGNLCVLTIKKVAESDAGTYVCTAANPSGKDSTSAKLNVVGEARRPEFTKELADAVIPDGSPVRFEVRVEGSPAPVVEWFKDQKPLKPGVRFEILTEENVHSFTITSCREDDGGKYTCKAKNKYGEASCEAALHIAEDTVPPRFTKKLYDVTASVGSVTELSVKFIGTPEPKISWFLDDELVEPEEHGVDIETALGSSSLLLEDVDVSDAGHYRCVATNMAGKTTTTAQITVVTKEVPTAGGTLAPIVQVCPPTPEPDGEAPSFGRKLFNAHVSEGKAISLEVSVSGQPRPEVSWFVEGEPVVQDRHLHVIQDGDKSTLVIDGALLDDEGVYKCVARNLFGKVECSAEVLVDETVSQPAFLKELSDVRVGIGEDASFEAEVGGHPEPSVSWFLNNVLIEPGGRFQTAKHDDVHSLIVRQSKPKDAGEIRCQAKNEAGEVQSVAALRVDDEQQPIQPFFARKPENAHVVEGGSHRFLVEVEGFPAPEIKWLDEDGEPVPSEGEFFCGPDGSLNVHSAELEDEGQYTCVASNYAGEVSATISLFVDEKDKTALPPEEPVIEEVVPVVKEAPAENAPGGTAFPPKKPARPPKFTRRLEDQVKFKGERARFEVRVTGSPDPTVEWYKGSTRLANAPRVTLKHEDDVHVLTLEELLVEDEGEYQCVARNDAAQSTCSCKLLVEEEVEELNFLQSLRDVEVVEHSDVRLEVHVSGTDPVVEWYRNGECIDEANRRGQHVDDPASGRFAYVISDARREDEGVYRCEATNSRNQVACEGRMSVLSELTAPEFLQRLEDKVVNEGSGVELEVEVIGSPNPTVTWYRNGEPVETSELVKSDADGSLHTLSFSNVKLRDLGEYTCKASNIAGQISCSAELRVREDMKAPLFIRTPDDVQITEGSSARFETILSGSPQPEIEWFKDGKPLKDSHSVKLAFDENHSVLTIREVKLVDEGEYMCTATNKVGTASCAVQLVVEETVVAPEFTRRLSSVELAEGDLARFDVRVVGTPEPQVRWFKENTELQDSEHYEMLSDDNMHSLAIRECALGDAGLYRCVATNDGGEAACTGELKVTQQQAAPCFAEASPQAFQSQPGEDVTLEAHVTGTPQPEVEWLKEEQPLVSSSHLSMRGEGERFTLTLHGARPEDSATYKCVAENPRGKAFKDFVVVIGGEIYNLDSIGVIWEGREG